MAGFDSGRVESVKTDLTGKHGGNTVGKNILHTIEKGMDGFSKGQKRIAGYMLENYDKAAFMTAS